jgi:hypothetical protein
MRALVCVGVEHRLINNFISRATPLLLGLPPPLNFKWRLPFSKINYKSYLRENLKLKSVNSVVFMFARS